MNIRIMLFVLFSLLSFGVMADIAVVVHPDSPISVMSKRGAMKIYVGIKKRHVDGARIEIVEQSDNSKIKSNFYQLVIGKSIASVKARWDSLLFSGEAMPPIGLSNDEEVLQAISVNRYRIGYVDSKSVDQRAKVVLIINCSDCDGLETF